jgi:oligoendopeptidase F
MAKKTASKSVAKGKTKPLPVWDLSDLYAGPNDPTLVRDMKTLEKKATAFARSYQGKLATLTGDDLAKAVAEYEKLQDGLGRIGSYAQLLYASDMSKPANTQFYQNAQEQLTVISSQLIFFGLEINKLSDATLAKAIKQSIYPWVRLHSPPPAHAHRRPSSTRHTARLTRQAELKARCRHPC